MGYILYIIYREREGEREKEREIDRYDNQEEVGTQHVFSYLRSLSKWKKSKRF